MIRIEYFEICSQIHSYLLVIIILIAFNLQPKQFKVSTHLTKNKIYELRFYRRKVWNAPLYEKGSSQESNELIEDFSACQIPKFDDRIPVSVKVVHSKRFSGPPQFNVSFHLKMLKSIGKVQTKLIINF